MYNAANSLRYCRACHRETAVVLDHASGNNVCSECALPLGERYVDVSSEWRAFAARADDCSRDVSGAAHHSPDHGQLGTGTTIACSAPGPTPHKVQANTSTDADTDPAEGAGVTPMMRAAVGAGAGAGVAPRMRGTVGPTPEMALVEAIHGIDDMAERLALSEAVKGHAKELFKKLEEAKAFPKGGKCRSRGALYAACLHTACRTEGVPRTFKELASVAGDGATGGMKNIGRLVKHIKKHLGEEAGPASHTGAVVRAGGYLLRFGVLLGMNNQEVLGAQGAAQRLEDALDVRRNPDSIAAGIIYMASQRAGASKSMRDVSTATGVSEVTIREVYHRDLCPHAELLFG